jgi:hypothetical protein
LESDPTQESEKKETRSRKEKKGEAIATPEKREKKQKGKALSSQ